MLRALIVIRARVFSPSRKDTLGTTEAEAGLYELGRLGLKAKGKETGRVAHASFRSFLISVGRYLLAMLGRLGDQLPFPHFVPAPT